MTRLFVQVSFTPKDDPDKLKPRTFKEYQQDMLIVEAESVVQWPVTYADESLVQLDGLS